MKQTLSCAYLRDYQQNTLAGWQQFGPIIPIEYSNNSGLFGSPHTIRNQPIGYYHLIYICELYTFMATANKWTYTEETGPRDKNVSTLTPITTTKKNGNIKAACRR